MATILVIGYEAKVANSIASVLRGGGHTVYNPLDIDRTIEVISKIGLDLVVKNTNLKARCFGRSKTPIKVPVLSICSDVIDSWGVSKEATIPLEPFGQDDLVESDQRPYLQFDRYDLLEQVRRILYKHSQNT